MIGLCCFAFDFRRHHGRAEEYIQSSNVNHRLEGIRYRLQKEGDLSIVHANLNYSHWEVRKQTLRYLGDIDPAQTAAFLPEIEAMATHDSSEAVRREAALFLLERDTLVIDQNL